MKTTMKKVFVWTCGRCGHQDFSTVGKKPRPECPGCANKFMPVRIIKAPDSATVAKAEREDAVRCV